MQKEGTSIPTLAELVVRFTADTSSLSRGFDEAIARSNGFGGLIKTLGSDVELAAGGMVVALGAVGIATSKMASDYQTEMMTIKNNTTMTTDEMNKMHDGILALSKDTGSSLTDLGDGMMHIVNITGDTSKAMAILAVANESAIATGAPAAQTANILAQAMHEYGLDTSTAATTTQQLADVQANAAHVMGVMHLAAAEGNMTLEQFNNAGGQAIAWAANLGVPLEQVSAAMATMTKHGFDASQAGTQTYNMLEHLIKPAKQSSDMLYDLDAAMEKMQGRSDWGKTLTEDFSAAGVKAKGLTGIVADLHSAFTGSTKSAEDQQKALTDYAAATGQTIADITPLQKLNLGVNLSMEEQTQIVMKLIPNIRGGAEMFTLLGTGASDYASILGDLNDKEKVNNVTQDNFNDMQKTAGYQWNVLKANVHAAGIEIGEKLLPYVTQMVTWFNGELPQAMTYVSGAFKTFSQALSGGLTNTSGLDTVHASIGNLGIIIRTQVIPDLQRFVQWMQSTFIPMITQAFTQKIIPAVTAFVNFIRNQVIPIIQQIIGWLNQHRDVAKALGIAIGVIVVAFQVLVPIITAVVAVFTVLVSPIGLVALAIAALAAVIVLIAMHWDEITAKFPVINTVLGAVSSFIRGTVIPAFEAFGDWFMSTGGPAIEHFVMDVALPALRAFGDWVVNTGLPMLGKFAEFLGNTIGAAALTAFDWIRGQAIPALGDLADWVNTHVIPAIRAFVSFLTDGLLPMAINVFDKLHAIVQNIVDFITDHWTQINRVLGPAMSELTSIITAAWDIIMTVIRTAIDVIGTIIRTGFDLIRATIEFALNYWKGIFNLFKDFLNGDWGKVWGDIEGLISNTMTYLGTVIRIGWDLISSIITTVMDAVKDIISTGWTFIEDTAKNMWDAISGDLHNAWDAINAVATGIWDTLKQIISWAWDSIKSTADTVWGAITSALSTAWNAITSLATTVWSAITSVIGTAWQTISDAAGVVWGAITSALTISWNAITALATTVWNAITSAIGTAWQTISDAASTAWTTITNTLQTDWNTISSAVTTVWNTITSSIQSAWDAVKKIFTDAKDALSGAIMGAFNDFRDNIGSVMKAAGNNLLQPLRDALSGFGVFVSGILGAINWVGGKLGLGDIVPGDWSPPTIPQLATGTDSWKGGPAMVGENGQELIESNGVLQLATSAMVLDLPAGARVISASDTADILSGRPSSLSGTSHSLGADDVSMIQNLAKSEVFGGDLQAVLTDALSGRPSANHSNAVSQALGKGGFFDTLKNTAGGAIDGLKGVGSGVAGEIRGWMAKGGKFLFDEALKALGVDAPTLPGVFGSTGSKIMDMLKTNVVAAIEDLIKGIGGVLPAAKGSIGSGGGAPQDLIDAITTVISDPREQRVALMASALETHWQNIAQIGGGPGRGYWQIEAGPGNSNSGISEADAYDPIKALQYMYDSHNLPGAVAEVPDDVWSSNPELAHALAAHYFENGPMYDQARIDTAWGMMQPYLTDIKAGPNQGTGTSYSGQWADVANLAAQHIGETTQASGIPWDGWCEKFVDDMDDAAGYGSKRWGTAFEHGNSLAGRTSFDPPPAGASIWFDQSWGSAGHAAIATGNGNEAISTPIADGSNAIHYANIVGDSGYMGWAPPGMALGTVAAPNNPFVAMLGDNKVEDEVVSPVSTMREAMRAELNATGQQGGSPIIIQVSQGGWETNEQFITRLADEIERRKLGTTGQDLSRSAGVRFS